MQSVWKSNDIYTVHNYSSRDEWLKGRAIGIGGSDASTLINMNPYKTSNRLWKEKKGLIEVKEVDNSAIRHGKALEPILDLFLL